MVLAPPLQHGESRLAPVGAGGARGGGEGPDHLALPVGVGVGAGALLQAGEAVAPIGQAGGS